MSAVTIACGDQSLEDLQLQVDQTNELVLTIKYSRSGDPIPNTSAITCAFEDGGTVVTGSAITLGPESSGVFSGIFPILTTMERGRTYDLRIMVTIEGTLVINKTFPVTTI
jgi:hypothetical protein